MVSTIESFVMPNGVEVLDPEDVDGRVPCFIPRHSIKNRRFFDPEWDSSMDVPTFLKALKCDLCADDGTLFLAPLLASITESQFMTEFEVEDGTVEDANGPYYVYPDTLRYTTTDDYQKRLCRLFRAYWRKDANRPLKRPIVISGMRFNMDWQNGDTTDEIIGAICRRGCVDFSRTALRSVKFDNEHNIRYLVIDLLERDIDVFFRIEDYDPNGYAQVSILCSEPTLLDENDGNGKYTKLKDDSEVFQMFADGSWTQSRE